MAPGRRKPSTLGLTLRVAVVSGVATLVLLAGLAWQMVSGADPALTASQPAAQGAATSAASGGTAAATTASAAPVVSAPAPVTSSTS
ncbi:MAG: hypothetical protein ACXWZ3_04810 [Solirubrobacterales bacterium]